MVEVKKEDLNFLILSQMRWLIKSKNYQTSKCVKIIKKYYHYLDKSTQTLIKNEIAGRIKQINHSHPNPKQLHYFKSYSSLLEFINE